MHVRICRPCAYRHDDSCEVASRKVLGWNGDNVCGRNRSLDDFRAHRTRWPAAATAQEDSHTPTGGWPAQVDMGRPNVRIETLIAKLKVNRGFILTDCG